MVSLFATFFTYIDLKANMNINRTVVIIIVSSILTKFIMPGVFNMGFVNTITPEEIGSTFITTLMCWLNFSNSIPSTLGLKLVSKVNYEVFAIICILLQSTAVLAYRNYAAKLDTMSKEE